MNKCKVPEIPPVFIIMFLSNCADEANEVNVNNYTETTFYLLNPGKCNGREEISAPMLLFCDD